MNLIWRAVETQPDRAAFSYSGDGTTLPAPCPFSTWEDAFHLQGAGFFY
jgi:hypothetical protein